MPDVDDAKTGQTDSWVLIVEDHPLFREALILTLRSLATYGQVRTAGNLQEALAVLGRFGEPGLVIFDLSLPDVKSLDGLVRVKGKAGAAPIIVVSAITDHGIIDATLRAGAAGFVPKHSSRAVVCAALRAVAEGGTFVPEDFTQPDGEIGMAEAAERLATLTEQQKRILALVCEGKLNKQIAYDLTITETTVKAHITAIMRKLGVITRTQAVLMAKRAEFAGAQPKIE